MSDIARIADTVSTQGMDSHQTESVTRIRYIVHECLKDQVGTSMLVSSIPQVEHGKRIRGKERVRRQSNGKRRRRDDPVQCQAASTEGDPDQSQLRSEAAEIDYSQLCLTDGLQLCHAGSGGVDEQLHTTIEVDGTSLCHPANDLEDDTETCITIAVTEVDDDSQVCHTAMKDEVQAVSESSLETSEDVVKHNSYSIVV